MLKSKLQTAIDDSQTRESVELNEHHGVVELVLFLGSLWVVGILTILLPKTPGNAAVSTALMLLAIGLCAVLISIAYSFGNALTTRNTQFLKFLYEFVRYRATDDETSRVSLRRCIQIFSKIRPSVLEESEEHWLEVQEFYANFAAVDSNGLAMPNNFQLRLSNKWKAIITPEEFLIIQLRTLPSADNLQRQLQKIETTWKSATALQEIMELDNIQAEK